MKRYALRVMESTQSFEYTRTVLTRLYAEIRDQISALGGNDTLSKIIDQLAASASLLPTSESPATHGATMVVGSVGSTGSSGTPLVTAASGERPFVAAHHHSNKLEA